MAIIEGDTITSYSLDGNNMLEAIEKARNSLLISPEYSKSYDYVTKEAYDLHIHELRMEIHKLREIVEALEHSYGKPPLTASLSVKMATPIEGSLKEEGGS